MRSKELINKPIITRDDGKIIYRIDDVVFDPESCRIIALLAEGGSLFAQAKIVPFEKIEAIGPSAVTIASKNDVVAAGKHPKIEALLSKEYDVRGKRVVTEDGKELGVITDIAFDEKSGKSEGFDVMGGLFSDIYKGRSFVPAPKLTKVGQDVVFVPADTASIIEEQVGGAMGVFEQAKSKTGEMIQKTKEKTKQYAHEYREGGTGSSMKESASSAWDQIKQSAGSIWSRTSDEARRRRINDALGRPTTRVIYSESDEIILNTGEIITHEAIERAERAGALPALLDSVYKGTPKLSDEDFRADGKGGKE